MSSGYLYILSNAAMPGLLKIGRTDRQPEQRARELHTTGVPHPFVLEHYAAVEDSANAEAQVHKLLQSNGVRISSDREFFSVSLLDAIEALSLVSSTAPQAPDFSRAAQLAELAATVRPPRPGSGFDEHEFVANQLAKLARRGYPDAMKQAAILFEQGCPSGSHFKQLWRDYLALAREQAAWHPLASSNGQEYRASVGRDIAEYIYCCFRHGWLNDEDFAFVSSFLVRGDKFQYEGYMSELPRYKLPEAVTLEALNV